MNVKQLIKNLHQPYRLVPIMTNATLPDSPWLSRKVNRTRGCVLFENPATGYRLPLEFCDIHHFDQVGDVGSLVLNVGFFFDCPNVFILDLRRREWRSPAQYAPRSATAINQRTESED